MAKKLKSLKSSKFSRQLSLAKLTFRTSTKLAIKTMLSKSSLSSKDYDQLVKVWTEELGRLKGSLMKIGQMLSIYGEYFLPENANKLLKSLQFESPPLDWKVIEAQIKKNVNHLEELEIEKESIGSASIGQVHRARILKTGEAIVLKAQYPGIKEAIDNDLSIFRSLLSFWKLLPDKKRADFLFEEVRSMLYQEMDYEQELDFTIDYANKLKGHDGYIVASAYPRFSSEFVLATEYIEADKIDSDEVRNLSQDRRNRIALLFLDLYFKELFQWKIVQTDPHFGNYRIKIDKEGKQDALVLFDFGAMRVFPDSFVQNYKRLISSVLYSKPANFELAAERLGILKSDDSDEQREFLLMLSQLIVEPFLPKNKQSNVPFFDERGRYCYGESDLPQRIMKRSPEIFKKFPLRLPPHEFLFLDRKLVGTYTFLAKIDARLDAREILEKYLV